MKRSFVSLASLLFLGCGPAVALQAPKPTPLAVATQGDVSVELLTFGPLVVGQNRVFYRVTRDGAPVPHAELEQRPMMEMAGMAQGCPLVNPDHAPNADGLWEGLIVFTDAEAWGLKLKVELEHEGTSELVDFGHLSVSPSSMEKVVTRDGKQLVITLGYAEAPHTGANPVVITAHQAKDATMTEFITVDDLVFTLTPEMPSMGHGAAGSMKPTRGEDGLYRATVVLSMPGDWVLHLGVAANDAPLSALDFALEL